MAKSQNSNRIQFKAVLRQDLIDGTWQGTGLVVDSGIGIVEHYGNNPGEMPWRPASQALCIALSNLEPAGQETVGFTRFTRYEYDYEPIR